MDAPDGTLPGRLDALLFSERASETRYGDRPLRSVALCYVYYSVVRLIVLFAGLSASAGDPER